VSINAFRDFFVKDGRAYSIVECKKFVKQGKEDRLHMKVKEFIQANLVKSDKYKELLVVCNRLCNLEVVSHACTFLRHTPVVGGIPYAKYYDPNLSNFEGRGEETINYERHFAKQGIITVYKLEGREVSREEQVKIKHKMQEVMTGEKPAESLVLKREKEVQNAKSLHRKRKSKGWCKPMLSKDAKKEKREAKKAAAAGKVPIDKAAGNANIMKKQN
jgi:hypothetical protein